MKKIILLTCVLVLFAVPAELLAHAAKMEVVKDDTIIQLEQQVRKLIIEDGDKEAALAIYARYARDNKDNSYYKDQYSILRRVIKMENVLESSLASPDHNGLSADKMNSYLLAVRSYYYDKGYYSRAVDLDRQALQLEESVQNITNCLESLLLVNDMAGASEVMEKMSAAGLQSENVNPDYSVMGALLVARNGDIAGGVKLLEAIELSAEQYPRCLVYSAAIYKLAGERDKFLTCLVKALENTAPTQMATTRGVVESMSEFQDIVGDEQYLAALQTESKVYQSDCTGGSSCNSCSLKGSCPSSN